jgi:hypothetical protein
MINADIRREFEHLAPAGERSKVVNETLKKGLFSIKIRCLTERLLHIRAKNVLFTNEILDSFRTDRARTVQP